MDISKASDGVKFLIDCRDPFFFLENMYGLTPQIPKPEYEEFIRTSDPTEWEAHHFGECERVDLQNGRYYMKWKWYDGEGGWIETRADFLAKKWITWQQSAILMAIKNHTESLDDPIALQQFLGWLSIVSGHGIGKSAGLSWIILWFLFCFPECQIAATAPSRQQMFDILWKELSIWLSRMPSEYENLYDWQSSHIRMEESPKVWFARATTARKENPEALAGVHGEHVLLVADEASGVEEVIFQTAEGATTGPHIMFIMIGNGVRNTGYFKDSHKKHEDGSLNPDWIQFSFSCEESPVVDVDYLIRMATKYDREEDNFRIRVLGLFPHEEQMDDKGWMPLISEDDLYGAFVLPDTPFKARKMGVDPSGAGSDKSAWVGANTMLVKILKEEKISTAQSGSRITCTLATEHDLGGDNIILDSFGKGADWLPFINRAGKDVDGMNSGDSSKNKDYLNKRAEGAWGFRTFLKQGGQIVRDERWKEVLNIKYRRTNNGKIQIMSKVEMKKLRIPSPNFFDGASYCFVGEDASVEANEEALDAETAKYEAILRKRQMKRFR